MVCCAWAPVPLQEQRASGRSARCSTRSRCRPPGAVRARGAGGPSAPPVATPVPTADQGVRLVRFGGPRRHRDQLHHRQAARSDRAAAPGDRATRCARQCQAGDELRRRTGARRSGQGGPAAVRGGRRRWRRQLLASAGRRRGRRFDGAQRADPDAVDDEHGHHQGGFHRMVDGRLWRHAAGLPAGSGAHCRDLRRSARRCISPTPPARWAHSTATTTGRTTLSSDRLRCRRFRCGSTAATTIGSRPPPISSSPSSAHRPPAGSRPAATTRRIGVSSCRANWPGCILTD